MFFSPAGIWIVSLAVGIAAGIQPKVLPKIIFTSITYPMDITPALAPNMPGNNGDQHRLIVLRAAPSEFDRKRNHPLPIRQLYSLKQNQNFFSDERHPTLQPTFDGRSGLSEKVLVIWRMTWRLRSPFYSQSQDFYGSPQSWHLMDQFLSASPLGGRA
jgi:hypothetical protein